MHIVIADQQVDVREAIRLLLEETLSSTDFYIAANPTEVIDFLQSTCVDALVVDWELLTCELLTSARTLCPTMRVVVLSVRPELRQIVLRLGVDAFVCKGDPPEYLIAALNNPA